MDSETIKDLILNGDYFGVSQTVAVQHFTENDNYWVQKGYGSEPMTFSPHDEDFLHQREWKSLEDEAKTIITLLRRRCKKEDILLYCYEMGKVDGKYSMEAHGIVFTRNRILTWFEKKPEYIIEYREIAEVDYNDTSVIITVEGGETADLYCGTEENYAKEIYNLIMDILDSLLKE